LIWSRQRPEQGVGRALLAAQRAFLLVVDGLQRAVLVPAKDGEPVTVAGAGLGGDQARGAALPAAIPSGAGIPAGLPKVAWPVRLRPGPARLGWEMPIGREDQEPPILDNPLEALHRLEALNPIQRSRSFSA
jgi:hypothetical protein